MDDFAWRLPQSAPASMQSEPSAPPPAPKPLPPPRGDASWAFKEPKEFLIQQERALERAALKEKKLANRRALQEQGYTVALYRPTIKHMDCDPPPRYDRGPLRDVWGPPPCIPPSPKKASSVPSLLDKSLTPKKEPPPHYMEDNRATIGGQRAKIDKEMWSALQKWSRGHSGNPWTLKQVYAEVEADVGHYKARDTRAKLGKMGPKEMGANSGTTKKRRELMVQFPRNYGRNTNDTGNESGQGFNAAAALANTFFSMPALVNTPAGKSATLAAEKATAFAEESPS